jgi:hypothetical protein
VPFLIAWRDDLSIKGTFDSRLVASTPPLQMGDVLFEVGFSHAPACLFLIMLCRTTMEEDSVFVNVGLALSVMPDLSREFVLLMISKAGVDVSMGRAVVACSNPSTGRHFRDSSPRAVRSRLIEGLPWNFRSHVLSRDLILLSRSTCKERP